MQLKQFTHENTILLVPNSIKIPRCLAHFPTYFYYFQNKDIHYDRVEDNKTLLIYAPSFIGTWVLYRLQCKISPKIKIIVDHTSLFNTSSRILIKLCLLYEKFRLGSDVTSPFITHRLNRLGYYQILKDITIGDWLSCLKIKQFNNDHYIII